jgi:hypothetical protein
VTKPSDEVLWLSDKLCFQAATMKPNAQSWTSRQRIPSTAESQHVIIQCDQQSTILMPAHRAGQDHVAVKGCHVFSMSFHCSFIRESGVNSLAVVMRDQELSCAEPM